MHEIVGLGLLVGLVGGVILWTTFASAWHFSVGGVAVSPNGPVSPGQQITAMISYSYTGPGGIGKMGVILVDPQGVCSDMFSDSQGFESNGDPTLVLTSGVIFPFPNCPSCQAGGATLTVIPFVVDPGGKEWRGTQCASHPGPLGIPLPGCLGC